MSDENALPRKVEQLQVTLALSYDSWWNDMPFGCLTEENVVNSVSSDDRSLFQTKALAVRHKWEMLCIAAAEVNAACDFVIARNRPAIPMSLQGFLTLKIETFLVIARSLLDVLSTCLAILELSDRRVQSFNDLRRRKDCPEWLKNYVAAEMVRSNDLPLAKIGWLSMLMSEKEGDQSLRDFVAHRGIAKFHFRELPFEEGWDLVFQPRQNDEFVLPIKDVVQKIVAGVNALAAKVEEQIGKRGVDGKSPAAE